jgi:pilus assembly protein CpaB
MNRQRIFVLAGAFVAAIVVALLVSHLLGGGAEKAKAIPLPPKIAMSDILVAAADLSPGTQLTSSDVRWQQWPKASVAPGFITRDANPNLDNVVNGAVVRAPLVAGEPLTTTKIVEHAQGAGLMAAILTPGMRAVSIPITTETGAGGFILPNDRVDVITTQLISDSPRRFRARTVLSDIRVLAVDQTYEGKDQKTVLAKTATLELTPEQTEIVIRAQAAGTLSLALRALSDSDASANTLASTQHDAPAEPDIIRFGIQGPSIMGGRN